MRTGHRGGAQLILGWAVLRSDIERGVTHIGLQRTAGRAAHQQDGGVHRPVRWVLRGRRHRARRHLRRPAAGGEGAGGVLAVWGRGA